LKTHNYEKKAFIQIYLGYFISVTIFVILLGFLYYNQQKIFVLQKSAMNMHQYITMVKHSNFQYKQKGYSYIQRIDAHVVKQLPKKEGKYYIKAFSKHFIVRLDAKIVDQQLNNIRNFTILLQMILILFFAVISWILTKKSLKPMSDTISHLDRFTKDLVHDLNTPITSILLNTKLLKKSATDKQLKQIHRIENSAKGILGLYANLEVLLDDQTVVKEQFDLKQVVDELIEIYKVIYSDVVFEVTFDKTTLYSNKEAIKRILDNIISNGCKYRVLENPTITIIYKNDILTIQDNGKGIKYPQKIFERMYKEDTNGHGIGMHIVYRLCDHLGIDIGIVSQPNQGTQIILKF